MAVNHEEIAERLGLARSTVTKILNQLPYNRASSDTIQKVFQTARELGYDFSRLRNIHRRRGARKNVNIRAKLHIGLREGGTFDTGTARIRNLNNFGALLTDIETAKMAFPLVPFDLIVEILDPPLHGIEMECQVVRLVSKRSVEVGVNFLKLKASCESRIVEYLKEEEALPGR